MWKYHIRLPSSSWISDNAIVHIRQYTCNNVKGSFTIKLFLTSGITHSNTYFCNFSALHISLIDLRTESLTLIEW